MTNAAVSGAADDRTFVVSASTPPAVRGTNPGKTPVQEAATWYLVRISPGAAQPVRVTRLPMPALPANADVRETALSGDGTELAVLSVKIGESRTVGAPLTLQVYSVATGRLQHSWPAGIDETQANRTPISDLSWVGDSTVGFAVTYTPAVREEVRTLDVSASGATLLADSRVVWSQYVPASRLTPEEKATILALEPTRARVRHAVPHRERTGGGVRQQPPTRRPTSACRPSGWRTRSRRRRGPASSAAFRNHGTCQPSTAPSAWTGRTRPAPRSSAPGTRR